MSFDKRGGAPDDEGAAADVGLGGGGALEAADEAAEEGPLLEAGLGELPDGLGDGAGLLLLLPWARAVADNMESVTTAESRATRRSEGREERMMSSEIDRGWTRV